MIRNIAVGGAIAGLLYGIVLVTFLVALHLTDKGRHRD